MRIWICCTGGLGDTLVSLPAIHELQQRYPDAEWTLLTHGPGPDGGVSAWDVLKHTALFTEVIRLQPARPRQVWSILRRLWVAPPDKLYYLSPASTLKQKARDWVLLKLLGRVPRVIGLEVSPEDYLKYDERGRLRRMEKVSERLLSLVREDNGPVQGRPVPEMFAPPPAASARAGQLLHQAGVPLGSTLVALGIGSKMPAKRWPLERFQEVGTALLAADPRLHLLVLGGSEDAAAGERLCAVWGPRSANLAGSTDVIESAAVLQRCALYVGNDTGTMHLAAAMGVSTVGIFTSRDKPGRWEPIGDRNIVLRKELSCSGCMLEVCEKRDMECLRLITVAEVLDASRLQLGARLAGRTAS